ncbi:MAG: response regulator [Gemmataceae bacterium]
MRCYRIRLKGIGPMWDGKFWEFTGPVRIGRQEDQEVVLSDPSVSRRHAEIIPTERGWMIRDLASTNGTFLNGVRLGPVERKLRLRDVIQVGTVVLMVAILEEEVTPPIETPSAGMQVEATTQQPWEKALEVLASDQNRRPGPGERLLAMLRAGYHLGHVGSLSDLLHATLEDIVTVLDAQRGAIILADPVSGQLALRAVYHRPDVASQRPYYSNSLAQRCYSLGESILCRNTQCSPELQQVRSIADGGMASIICALLRSPRKKLGILHLDRHALQEAFTLDDLHLADAVAASISAGIECAYLVEAQQQLFLQTVTALAQAVELRDQYTGGHTQRVTDYSMLLAEELRLSQSEKRYIQIGTPLHDIGKIGIDDAILRKPGRLTPDEYEIMKSHTVKGAAILETIPELAPVIPIVRHHHERWDGTGYPDGLAQEAIPLLARIVAVADAFDAMTSHRSYRPCLTLAQAFEEVRTKAGSHFDPKCAAAFLSLRPRIEEIFQRRMDDLGPPPEEHCDEQRPGTETRRGVKCLIVGHVRRWPGAEPSSPASKTRP